MSLCWRASFLSGGGKVFINLTRRERRLAVSTMHFKRQTVADDQRDPDWVTARDLRGRNARTMDSTRKRDTILTKRIAHTQTPEAGLFAVLKRRILKSQGLLHNPRLDGMRVDIRLRKRLKQQASDTDTLAVAEEVQCTAIGMDNQRAEKADRHLGGQSQH